MPVKMIATDLDRTLLRTDKTISEYTALVFRRCREQGIKTVIATARPVRAVKTLDLNICFDAAVFHNGAVTVIEDKVYSQSGIETEAAKRLLLKAAEIFRDLQISVEIDDVLYANFDAWTLWKDNSVLTDFNDLPDKPADKIIFGTAESSVISEIQKILPDYLYAVTAENRFLMVMHEKARKRNAVMEIARHFRLSTHEIAAFGDDHNDMEMLRDCGFGIAVADAVTEAREAAGFICENSDSDGVAKWIEDNVLA